MKLRIGYLLLIALLLPALIAACSDDDDEDGGAASNGPESSVEKATFIFDALNDQQLDDASRYFCQADRDALAANPPIESAPAYDGVTCVRVVHFNDGFVYPQATDLAYITVSFADDVFTVRLENISGDSSLETAFAPGIWVIHQDNAPLYTTGQADTGLGLEALAEDGDPSELVGSLADSGYETLGAFENPIPPGDAYEFTITAAPGDRLSFAMMVVETNDVFLGTIEAGISLYRPDGTPLNGDVTESVLVWDAGTEVNQSPGTGNNQAPRQSGSDTGGDEGGIVISESEAVQCRYALKLDGSTIASGQERIFDVMDDGLLCLREAEDTSIIG